MRPYVIVPTFNERDNIDPLIDGVLAADASLHLIVIDDASPDGTAQAVAAWQLKSPRVRLIERSGRLGYGTAVRLGMTVALKERADWLIQMDADLSHDPSTLPALLRATADADLVIGSRYIAGGVIENWGWFRRLLSAVANRVARTLLALPVADCTSGFRCYRADLVERARLWEIEAEGYGFLSASLYRCRTLGARVTEVPIRFVDRQFGRSKLSRRVIWEAMRIVLRLGWRHHLVSWTGEREGHRRGGLSRASVRAGEGDPTEVGGDSPRR